MTQSETSSVVRTIGEKRLRVLFWCELFPPSNRGGVEMFALQLIHELQRKGLEIRVICDRGSESVDPETVFEGIMVYRFPIRDAIAGGNMIQIKTLVQNINAIFSEWQPDLVHMNTLELGVFAYLRCSHRKRCPMILTLHYALGSPMFSGKLQRLLIDEATGIVGVSNHIYQGFIDRYHKHQGKTHRILNALKMPSGTPPPMPDGPLRLFSAGLLCEEKGFDLVLDALAELGDPSTRWTLAGNGPVSSILKEKCVKLGLSDQVTFLGRISWKEVYEQIDQSHVMIVPSRWQEPFGLVALQALQRARPVIASNRGGLPEIVEHGVNGWLFEPDDPHDLATRIADCRSNRPFLEEMGRSGTLRAEKEFTVERMAIQYETLFRQTIASRHVC